MAAFRRGDGGTGACEVSANSGSWRPTRRLSRPSTASAWSVPRARPAARVISRVSSPTSLATPVWLSVAAWNSEGPAGVIPVGVPKPPTPPLTARPRIAVVRAPDERSQVDLGQDVTLQQESVGLVVRLFGEQRQLLVDHRLQQPPGVEAERRRQPRAGDDARQHVRPQDVVGVELVAALEHVHARAQVGELPRGAVHHRQRQARAQDLVLDRVVVDQAQIVVGRCAVHGQLTEPRLGDGAGLEGGAQQRRHAVLPDREGALEHRHQLAAPERDRRLGDRGGEHPRALVDRLHDDRHSSQQPLRI